MKIEQKLKKELKNLKFDEPLKKWTTFKIGGPARYFFVAENEADLIKAIKISQQLKIPYFILGEGSNLLVSDEGFKGLIIKIKNKKLKIKNINKNFKNIKVGAGILLNQLVIKTIKLGLTGLEWAVGIPGTLGGAIYGNSGLTGQKNISSVIEKVKVLEIKDSKFKIKNFSKNDCRFGYRKSIFQHKPNLVILSACLKLKKGDKEEIKKEISEILKRRKEKIPNGFSAGCIFKNPEFSNRFSKFLKLYPEWQIFKKSGIIPAGWLIEKAGLKGKKIGGAKVSEKHANFIINEGRAKAEDVIKLIDLIKKKVKEKFSLKLEEEIKLLGF